MPSAVASLACRPGAGHERDARAALGDRGVALRAEHDAGVAERRVGRRDDLPEDVDHERRSSSRSSAVATLISMPSGIEADQLVLRRAAQLADVLDQALEALAAPCAERLVAGAGRVEVQLQREHLAVGDQVAVRRAHRRQLLARRRAPQPPAVKTSCTWRKHPSATAWNSACFVPNSRITYGCDTPARRAMASVVAAW